MRPQNSHPQKRVLVEHVADDVRALKQDTKEQQKVVLTGRAIADLLTGDTFDATSSFDAKYFTGGVPDFNKVTDASIRYVTWKYANGPTGVTIPGFLYTFVQLPSGKLTWLPDGKTQRSHDGELAIRQIFYVDEQFGDIESYTRTAKNIDGEWVWSPYWHTMSGRVVRVYIGPEQAAAGLLAKKNLRQDTIYEMHCGGQRIVLPDADTWRLGATLAFEQYANPDPSGAVWTNVVASTEVVDATGRTEDYETILTPPLKHGRTSEKDLEAGMWHMDVSQASIYKFDCIDRDGQGFKYGGKTYSRTWMLDVDPEAITALADITALLGAHTDQFIPDLVRYGDRYQETDTNKAAKKAVTLVTSRQATMNGIVKFAFKFNKVNVGSLTNNFRIRIYRFNETTDASVISSFEYKKTTDTTASLYKKYYFSDGAGGYNPVNGTGYTDSFADGVDYYERTVQWSASMSPADWLYSNDASTSKADFFGKTDGAFKRTDSRLINCEDPTDVGFVGYFQAYRNDTIMVVIESSDHYADSKIVSPSVEFFPDAHDSYLSKLNIDNKSVFPGQLAKSTTPGSKKDQVAGATALTEAVRTIVSQLQGKGMFWGALKVNVADLDNLIATGLYNTYSSMGYAALGVPWMAGNAYVPVFVINNEVFDANQVEPPTGTPAMPNNIHVTQIAFTTATCTQVDAASASPAGMWIRYGRRNAANKMIWSQWTAMQNAPMAFYWDAVAKGTSIGASDIINYMKHGNPHIVVHDDRSTGNKVTVTLPPAQDYPHTKFHIETRGVTVTIRQKDPSDASSYMEFEDDTKAESLDHMLYPIESDGTHWFVIVAS